MENFHETIKVELDALKKKLFELQTENERLKEIIVTNELEDEIPEISCISTEEKICIDGIRHIAALVEEQNYSDKDIKNFDILYRTLRTIKGKESSAPAKAKEADIKDLLKIVEGK